MLKQNKRIFSIDDSSTNEIDDAFSVYDWENNSGSGYKIGIHIALPAFEILQLHDSYDLLHTILTKITTIYCPNKKITMLGNDIINKYSLNAGSEKLAFSMYVYTDQYFKILDKKFVLEAIYIDNNLSFEQLNQYSAQLKIASNGMTNLKNNSHNNKINKINKKINHNQDEYDYFSDLVVLYKFALQLEKERLKNDIPKIENDSTNNIKNDIKTDLVISTNNKAANDKKTNTINTNRVRAIRVMNQLPEYQFDFDQDDKINIKIRDRDNPIDKIVSELMIYINYSYAISDLNIRTIYRYQKYDGNRFTTLSSFFLKPHYDLNLNGYTWISSPIRRSFDFINQCYFILHVYRLLIDYIAINNSNTIKNNQDICLTKENIFLQPNLTPIILEKNIPQQKSITQQQDIAKQKSITQKNYKHKQINCTSIYLSKKIYDYIFNFTANCLRNASNHLDLYNQYLLFIDMFGNQLIQIFDYKYAYYRTLQKKLEKYWACKYLNQQLSLFGGNLLYDGIVISYNKIRLIAVPIVLSMRKFHVNQYIDNRLNHKAYNKPQSISINSDQTQKNINKNDHPAQQNHQAIYNNKVFDIGNHIVVKIHSIDIQLLDIAYEIDSIYT